MKLKTGRFSSLLVIVCLVLTLGAGSALGGETGVTDKSIKVGASLDLTGPIAFVGKQLTDGLNVGFSAVNAAGGINGRKIEFVVEDNGYNPSRAVASVVKLAGRDKVFAIVGSNGTAPTLAMLPAIEREGVPLVGIGAFSPKLAIPPKQLVFHVLTNYDDQMRIGLDYIVKDLGVKNPKLGIIYQDDDFGQDCLNGLKQQADMYGIPIIAEASYKRGTVDFNPQVVRMMQAGADFVFLATVYRETAGVVKEAAKLGYKANFVVSAAAADAITLKLAGTAGEGLIGVACGELVGSQRAGWKKYVENTKKYGKGKPAFYHSVGYLFAQVFCEGLRLTGKDLTRERFIKGMEKMKDFDTGVGPNITFGPQLRAGAHSAFVVKAKQGRFEKITDWREPTNKP